MARIILTMLLFLTVWGCKKDPSGIALDSGNDLQQTLDMSADSVDSGSQVDAAFDLPVSTCQPQFDGEVGAKQLFEGLYVVHSGRRNTTLDSVDETSNIFVFGPDESSGFWIFGTGFGDIGEEAIAYQLGSVESARPTTADARDVAHILKNCLGADTATSPINLLTPHGHYDHINPEFLTALVGEQFSLDNMTVFIHENDNRPATCNAPCCRQMPCDETSGSFKVPFDPMWTDDQLARFRTIGSRTDLCGDKILDIDTGDFGAWEVFYSPGHTPGSINLVNASQQILITGSPEDEFDCRAMTDLTWWPIHGTSPRN